MFKPQKPVVSPLNWNDTAELETREELIIRLRRQYRDYVIRAIYITAIISLFAGALSTALFLGNLPMRFFEVQCVKDKTQLLAENKQLKVKVDSLYSAFKDRDITLLTIKK